MVHDLDKIVIFDVELTCWEGIPPQRGWRREC